MVAPVILRLATTYRQSLASLEDASHLRSAVLLHLARELCHQLGFKSFAMSKSRLARLASGVQISPALAALVEESAKLTESEPRDEAAHRMGEVLDLLLAHEGTRERKKTGSYFTPRAVARDLVRRSLCDESLLAREKTRPVLVCDPACGGGAFLIEAARGLSQFTRSRKEVVAHVYGIDLSEVALATTEVALWIFVGDDMEDVGHTERFVRGDALLGRVFSPKGVDDARLTEEERKLRLDFDERFPKLGARGFDWVVGNPPWVAFQGRATQKITTERRAFYREHYKAFCGYPTLHGLFIERAAELAPQGHIALLVPSSVSDLEGYQATRATFGATHIARCPLPEYGQDVFSGVVQPCFGLIGTPQQAKESHAGQPWLLEERSHARTTLEKAPAPSVLESLDKLPALPPETFREVGFQSNRRVTSELFYRGVSPPRKFSIALLEGRNVSEFMESDAKLFLHPDEQVLRETNCRLKSKEAYAAVDIVVRQTAAFPIAARHGGAHFRNSLLGAFATEEISADLLVGLLNSALYRALHVSRQRDARQAVFPQVKVGHLRKLPQPPTDQSSLRAKIAVLSSRATEAGGLSSNSRLELDGAVFDLFGIGEKDREAIRAFLQERTPAAVRASRTS